MLTTLLVLHSQNCTASLYFHDLWEMKTFKNVSHRKLDIAAIFFPFFPIAVLFCPYEHKGFIMENSFKLKGIFYYSNNNHLFSRGSLISPSTLIIVSSHRVFSNAHDKWV